MSVFRRIKAAIARHLVEVVQLTPYVHGSSERVHLGRNVSTVNTLFNTASGDIWVGANTVFGHNVMVLTGRHEFVSGMRRRLATGQADTPLDGFDIRIGSGCWIASGAIITGGVTIGDNTIIGAGSVVTHDLPSGVFAAGVPARVIRPHAADNPAQNDAEGSSTPA